MRMTISCVVLIDAIIPDENKDNTTVYLHEKLQLKKLQDKLEYYHSMFMMSLPGSSKDKIWNETSNGNCAKGSEQSAGQSRCQLSATRRDKRCHCGLEQEF